MADDNLERITILLQARDRDFARAMDRNNKLIANLTRDATRNTARMQQQVETHFDRMGASVLSFGRNFVAGLGIGAATTAIAFVTSNLRDSVRSIARVGDEARRAGVPVEEFQQWSFVAEQNRIEIDQLVDGLKELNLRADEFITTGAGPASEAFTRLGYDAAALRDGLEDPSELMLDIIDRLQGLDRAAQIRVADEVFGGSAGERFVELIGQGEAGLRRTMQRAQDVGAVMETDMIQRAAILDQKFQELTTRVQRFFQASAVGLFAGGVETPTDTLERLFGTLDRARGALGEELFTALITQTGELADEAEAAASAVAEMVDPEQLTQSARWLRGEIAGLASALEQAGNSTQAAAMRDIYVAVNQAAQGFQDGTLGAEELTGVLGENAQSAYDVVTALGEVDSARFSSVLSALNGLIGRLNATRDAADLARDAMPGTGVARQSESFWDTEEARFSTLGRLAPTTSPRPRRAPATDSLGSSSSGGGGDTNGYSEAVEDIQARTRALQMEATALVAAAGSNQEYGAAIEYARVRAQLMNEAQEEGRRITPELQAEIDELARAYVTAGQNAEEAADSLRRIQEDADRGADAITSIFEAIGQGGDAARQALARLFQQMATSQFQQLLSMFGGTSGGGSFLSIIGGLIGGGKAGGGGVRAGVAYPVNENTPNTEYFIPSRSGGIMNVAQMKEAVRGGSAQSGSLAVAVGFDSSMGAFVATIRDETGAVIAEGFQQIQQSMPDQIMAYTSDPRRRPS